MAIIPVAGREALMATKGEGSRNTKKVAAKSHNKERVEMRTKRFAAESMANQSEDRNFGR